MITEICGTTPEASVFLRKMSAYPASETTPSWMRAPPESFSPMTGHPAFIARSITLQIFAAKVSDSEPPNTVKSWEKTNTARPSMRPWPVTTPSPGNALRLHAEIVAAVDDERVELLERARVEQGLDPLPRGELAGGVLLGDPLVATALPGVGVAPAHGFERRIRHRVSRARYLDFASPSPRGTS